MFKVLRVAVWCVMRAGQWSTAMGGRGVIDWLIFIVTWLSLEDFSSRESYL